MDTYKMSKIGEHTIKKINDIMVMKNGKKWLLAYIFNQEKKTKQIYRMVVLLKETLLKECLSDAIKASLQM